jgi:hypothetical protein
MLSSGIGFFWFVKVIIPNIAAAECKCFLRKIAGAACVITCGGGRRLGGSPCPKSILSDCATGCATEFALVAGSLR